MKPIKKLVRKIYYFYRYWYFKTSCKKKDTVIRSTIIHPDRFQNLHIGENVALNDAYLDTHGEITIEDLVSFGWGVKVLTGSHDYNTFGVDRHRKVIPRNVVIEEGAWIASYAILLPGSHIGKHAVVAAGSVVHGIVEPYTIVGGNPAKLIKRIEKR